MPRGARFVLANVPLHIVQRGIDGQPCFFAESDYHAYLRTLQACAVEYGCDVHAYCLMTNHVHLLATPRAQEACALMMKKLGQCYVQAVNQRLGRTGTLWEGRFYSCLVDRDDYVLTCYRYVELNPVRAGMVSTASHYRWTSYAANAEGAADPLIAAHPVYQALARDTEARRNAYRQLCAIAPSPLIIDELRRATRRGCAAGALRRRRGRPPKNGV